MLSKKDITAKAGGVAAGGDIKGSTLNIGVTVEALLDRLEKAKEEKGRFQLLLEQQDDQVTELSNALEVTERAVLGFLKILGAQEIARAQIEPTLRQIAERHIELTERLNTPSKSNDEPEIARRREQAAEAIDEGDYDRAAELLEEVVTIDRLAIAEHRDALDRHQLSAAVTLGQQGELERIRLNYRKAAGYFAEAAGLVPSGEDGTRLDYLEKQASVLRAQGQEFGDNAALVEATEACQAILEETSRERAPFDWARAQLNLGIALRNLGRRESGTESLRRAVKALQEALEISTRKNAPLDWAMTQLHLGIAFQRIGERESGTKHLAKAAQAYRHALEETSRERVPLDWATIQDNLGTALRSLGERQRTTERLEEAITAFKAALDERTRERVPLDWARTQQNLAFALMILGERENSTEKLEQAANAYEAALEERTRERVPLDWAMTQNNLGTALRIRGARENGTKRLEQAVECHKKALQEHTRERAPIQWGWVQYHLCLAYCSIAEKTADESALLQGLDAIKSALSVFEEAQHVYAIEMTIKGLADAQILLKALRGEGLPT